MNRSAVIVFGGMFCVLGGWAARPAPGGSTPPGTQSTLVSPPPVHEGSNLQRLSEIASARVSAHQSGDYVIGENDVLSVRAYDLDELNSRVRVDGNGDITLPLLNGIHVKGKTVADVQRELTSRLGGFMYKPSVTVFVEEYRSEQISVLGAVQHPGPISQTRSEMTVLDALAAAGGMTADASSAVYFIPAETRGIAGVQLADATTSPDANSLGDGAIVVDSKESPEDAKRRFFSMPVRGGDVIVVPTVGTFVAQGWVEKPGPYPLRPGMTLRGALATAGGLLWPARTSLIRVYSNAPNGQVELREVDFDDVMTLRTPDVFIHQGDVVEVPGQVAKMIPYGFYQFLKDFIHMGANAAAL